MPHILIVRAVFYEHISDMLTEGAVTALNAYNATYEIISVPGCFEIPATISMAFATGNYDGCIALGCVIRGETSHYDLICRETFRGLNEIATQFGEAIGNGVLTVENEAQALVRADINAKNKGGEAAKAALWMIELKEKLQPSEEEILEW
jgi:6,7-dimethyl-8-ribityllumazine synthase